MPKLISVTAALQAKGKYHDSLNLYLDVQRPGASASWCFIYEKHGKPVTLGLGSAIGGRRPKVPRDLARRKAAALITLLAEGKDPKQERLRQRAEGTTLGTLMERMLARSNGASPRVVAASRRLLVQHAARLLQMPAAVVNGDDLLTILRPLWTTIPARAEHLRQKLEALLDYAVVEGCRPAGPNPARWSGYFEHRLGARAAGGHHASMPFTDVPGFLQRLRAAEGSDMRALELVVLTGLRNNEVRLAAWNEVDLTTGRWTIPASRMKGRVEHVVLLSEPVLKLLRALPRAKGNCYVFAGQTPGRPIHDRALGTALGRLDAGQATVHGFRSSLIEWTKATRPHLEPIADWCLAHKPAGKVQQAYSRRQPIEQCGKLLAAWADYCTGASSRVVRLRA